MSIRETPVSNRYLDLKEKERAYKKHMEAVSKAKTTLDTSTPEVPSRLKVKEKADERYRRQLLSDYSRREKMISEVRKGKAAEFPDDYFPDDDDDVDIDQLMDQYGGPQKADKTTEANLNDDDRYDRKEVVKKETIKIGFSKDPEIRIEEEEEEDIQESPSKRKSRIPTSKIPIARKSPSAVKGRAKPSPEKLDVKSNKKVGFSPKPKQPKNGDERINIPSKSEERPITPSKSGTSSKHSTRPNTPSKGTPEEPESARRSRPSTANSTATFADDFDEDYNDNFDDEENDENNFDDNDDKENFDDDDSGSENDEKKKTLALAEISGVSGGDETEPMTQLKEDSDGMPELDLPDF